MATPVPPIHVLKRQAKRLRDDLRHSDAASIARARAVYHDLRDIPDDQVGQRMALNRCLHILACEQGFQTWEELLAAHQAQMARREPILHSADPDITWQHPLKPGEVIDGITGERRMVPPGVYTEILTDLEEYRRWSPSITHPSFARYAARQPDPSRESWGQLLKEVSAWAAERGLNVRWPMTMAPDADVAIPKHMTEAIYEFDICTSQENLKAATFDHAAFLTAFADRIRLVEVFPLYTIRHGTTPPDAPAATDRRVEDLLPLYGTSRGNPGVLLLRHRDGSPFRLNFFEAETPRPGETQQEFSIRTMEQQLSRRGIMISKGRNLVRSNGRWFRCRAAGLSWEQSSAQLEPMMRWLGAKGFGIEFAPGNPLPPIFGIVAPTWNLAAPFDREAFFTAFGAVVESCDPPVDHEGLDAYEQTLKSMIAAGQDAGASSAAQSERDESGDLGDDIEAERKKLADEMRSTPLSAENLQETRDFLHDSLGIEPTDDQIRAIIPPGTETHGIICAYGVEGDTATRDEIADRFCEHLVGRPHPLNGDHLTEPQLQAFFNEVITAAKKAGIPVADDLEDA